ncbi:MAG: OmpA family protein [Bacteroidota bacterium]
MKKVILLCLGMMLGRILPAQETVIWGSEVIDVSSEFSPYEYSAIQALHRPNVLPGGGENPNAWRPKKTNKEEFIVVAFANPIFAKQVAIAESENPGAVKKVSAYDPDYNEYTLFELSPRSLPIESRLLNLFFEETSYKIQAIKVELDGSVNEGYNAIDAIGISSSNIPINVFIKLAPGINTDTEAEKLSVKVNSAYAEHSPIVSPDGKYMYFSRQYHPGNIGGENDSEDIWVSDWDEEKKEWGVARNVGAPLNNKGPNFISSITEIDGEEVVILGNRYGEKGRMFTGVSMSKRQGDRFSDPVNIEIEDEYNYSPNADYFLVDGGKAMILSAERDDTYGKRDLYVSLKKQDNTWSAPKNLGPVLNSTGEDESPFLARDGKTLYFSSDGYSGYGGTDIYVSSRLNEGWTDWSEPLNMGNGINKEGDDEYFSIPPSGKQFYFTRGEKGEDTDIYTFLIKDVYTDPNSPLISSVQHLIDPEDTAPVLVTITGSVVGTKKNKFPKGVKVILESLSDGTRVDSTTLDVETGMYRFVVESGKKYAVSVDVDGYIAEEENFDFTASSLTDTINRNIKMIPIKKGETVVLKNVFFDFNRATLQSTSYLSLNRIVTLIQSGEVGSIEIAGHTDSQGTEEYNLSLSQRRAKAVKDYLISEGVVPEKLTVKAYGETRPLASNDSKEGRTQNRRVEFKIL